MSNENEHDDVVVIDREELEIKPPPMYNIVLLNDDYSPMDWVVFVLMAYFAKSEDEAGRIMLLVHTKGEGAAQEGLSHDVAATKAGLITEISQNEGHPLTAVVREV